MSDNDILGMQPVTGQTQTTPPAAVPIGSQYTAPDQSAQQPVQATSRPVITNPNDPATLEVPTQQPAQVVNPTSQYDVPQQQAQAPTSDVPTPEPKTEAAPAAEVTFFDPTWSYEESANDDAFARQFGRMCERSGVNPTELVRKLYNGGLSDSEMTALSQKLGGDEVRDWAIDGAIEQVNKHVQIEANRVYDVVGGKDAWDVVQKWAQSAPIDPRERQQINAELARGGLAAQAIAKQLLTAFNANASQEEKNAMISIINGTQPAAQQPAQPATPAQPQTLSGDAVGVVPAPSFEPIHTPRELAKISREAHNEGRYTPQFEDELALRLKKSREAGLYKGMSVKTAPPADIRKRLADRF